MRPLGLEYFHNEVVISVNVRMSRAVLVAGHGEAVAEADTPRGHGVSHACWCWLLTEHTAWSWGHGGCVSVQQPLSSGPPWPGHWFTSESGAFIADSRRQTAATHGIFLFKNVHPIMISFSSNIVQYYRNENRHSLFVVSVVQRFCLNFRLWDLALSILG